MVSTCVKSQTARVGHPGRLECLRRRYAAGVPVSLEGVFRAAHLSRREALVLQDRLAGRAFGAIAIDLGLTRQRAAQLEGAALGKLGVRTSLSVLVYADERRERAEVLRERGRRVKPAELHAVSA